MVSEDDNTSFLEDIAEMISEVSPKKKLYVVAGGGRIARFYIRSGRALGASEELLDEMGIEVTRLNARLLIAALEGRACPVPPKDYEEAAEAGKKHEVVVMGGVSPGITTDAVAAFLAERVGAKLLVNATSVDGAYTADPNKDRNAKKIPRMTHKELVDLVGTSPLGAGPNVVFDPTGAGVLLRTKIPLAIVNGHDLRNMRAALLGSDFEGTIVR